ncbi:MAG: hypothetical protein AB1480_00090 [Nitrospirota bacterium]
MRFKTIITNINLLNIMLIAVIIVLANYIILPMFSMSITYTLPAGKKIISDKDEKPAESHVLSSSDYTIIADENLFHPDRKIPVEKKAEQPLPKPEFVLYGTLITDDIKLAYIEDQKAPYSTQGRGRRQTVLKIGDIMSGFTVKEIDADKIVMARGEERIEVNLIDSASSKRRETGVAPKESRPPTEKAISPPSTKRPLTPYSTERDEKRARREQLLRERSEKAKQTETTK